MAHTGTPNLGMVLDGAWGRPYGVSGYILPDGRIVKMRRKSQRVRFYTSDGVQIGPEQANVAPAIVYAYKAGWRDEEDRLHVLANIARLDPSEPLNAKVRK